MLQQIYYMQHKIGRKGEQITTDKEGVCKKIVWHLIVRRWLDILGTAGEMILHAGNVAAKFYLKNLLVLRSETCQIT